MQLVNREFLVAFRQIIMQTYENIVHAQSEIDIQQEAKSKIEKFKDNIRSLFQRKGQMDDVDRDKRNRVQNQIMELRMFKVFKYLQSDEESQKDIADSPIQANESITEAK